MHSEMQNFSTIFPKLCQLVQKTQGPWTNTNCGTPITSTDLGLVVEEPSPLRPKTSTKT